MQHRRSLAFGPPSGSTVIGDWGELGASEDYNTCSPQASSDGTTRNYWSLQTEAGITLFCVTSQSKDASGQSLGDEEDCIEASADGTLERRARITINVPNVPTITSRNY
jgi:hypothetical protein